MHSHSIQGSQRTRIIVGWNFNVQLNIFCGSDQPIGSASETTGSIFITQSFLDVWLIVRRKIRVINDASQSKPSYILIFVKPWVLLEYILGVSWPWTSNYIPDPSHCWVFSERFRCVYVMKGVWSLLTDMLFNRLNQIIGRKFLMKLQLCWAIDFMSLEWVLASLSLSKIRVD